MEYYVDPNIRKAETLPADFYRDQGVFNRLREKAFLRSWQWIGDKSLVPAAGNVHPFILIEDFLEEPLVLVRDAENHTRCLSNVCTHRGNLVINKPGKAKMLTCMYHGRRFELDGSFESMPEFEETEDFPRPCDNLKEFPLVDWKPFLFTGLDPAYDILDVINRMDRKVGFLPWNNCQHSKDLSKDYLVNGHWALYCDNYLEGFHIPFVHSDLNAVLDYGSYTTELYDFANLQIGLAKDGEEVFDLPADHEDFGKNIGAYYFWIFPNTMFNFYPWGLSINIVKPIDIQKTKVSFITYLCDETKLDKGAGAVLDKVEKEDEAVVEEVQKGLQSRVYKTGRFSPTREQGVHHFHRLLADCMK